MTFCCVVPKPQGNFHRRPKSVRIAKDSRLVIPNPEKAVPEVFLKPDEPEKQEFISIKRIPSGTSLKVLCYIHDYPVSAVVDTAADVSIISKSVCDQLNISPRNSKPITLFAAGENQSFPAEKVGPISFKIGNTVLERIIFSAPICDEMLLGMDILQDLDAKIDVKNQRLQCNDEILPLVKALEKGETEEPRVPLFLKSKLKIPAESEVVISINSDADPRATYLLEPSTDLPVLVARTVLQGTSSPQVSLMNCSNETISLLNGTHIGTLQPLMEEEIISLSKNQDNGIKVRSVKLEPGKSDELPEHLIDLFNKASADLDEFEKGKLKETLIEFQDVFATSEYDLGNFSALYHHIDTGDARPIKLPLRRTPIHFIQEEDEILRKMLMAGVIQPSTSCWAAAPVLIRKKDGSVRWCLDYRRINEVTKKDVFPLPIMSECMDALDNNVWFSKLDANSAYWQIPVHPDSKEKTAFRTRQGLFEFNKLPFGLSNSPSTYCRAMNLVLRGLNWKIVLAFLDDLCVLGRSTEEHLKNLREVFGRLRDFQLKLKPKKCALFEKEVDFLGRKVSAQGVTLTDVSIETVKEWNRPESIKDVQRFLGFANFHRSFIKNFSQLTKPLHWVFRNKSFLWEEEQETAFSKVKDALISSPVLTIPNREGRFILDTDASNEAIGAELLQIQGGIERVIAFGSFSLTKQQRNYCTTRKELLAVVRFTNLFRHYLLGREFTIRTDHHSLIWLMNFKQPQGQLARWLEELSRFHMKIEHRPGNKHVNADALSRCNKLPECTSVNNLPCGGCPYCLRVLSKWETFIERVDDTVPLSSISAQEVIVGNEGILLTGSDLDVHQHKNRVCAVRSPGDNDKWDETLLREKQKEDLSLSFLRNWLEHKLDPSKSELLLADAESKYYWINRELFFLAAARASHPRAGV